MPTLEAKRGFTLLEICLCLLLLAIAATMCGIRVKGFIAQNSFTQGVSTLVSRLREAQGIAASYQIDLRCTLVWQEDKVLVQYSADDPLPLIDRSLLKIPHVARLEVGGKKAHRISLEIYSSGRIDPPLLIGLYHTEPEEDKDGVGLWVDLRSPLLITLSHS